MKLDALKIFGGVITFIGLLAVILMVVVPHCSKVELTMPPGHVACYKDPDCLEGQHCGFVPGYTAAVCIGTPISDKLNLE
jgi:hypothetical protein